MEKFVWFVARDTLARGYFRHLFWAAVAFVAFPLKMFLQDFRQDYHVSINTKSVSLVVVISPCVLNVWMIVWCYLAFAFWSKLTRCLFFFYILISLADFISVAQILCTQNQYPVFQIDLKYPMLAWFPSEIFLYFKVHLFIEHIRVAASVFNQVNVL